MISIFVAMVVRAVLCSSLAVFASGLLAWAGLITEWQVATIASWAMAGGALWGAWAYGRVAVANLRSHPAPGGGEDTPSTSQPS